MSIHDEIQAVTECKSTSDWLRQALATALHRDCVDAANDAEVLSELLKRRCAAELEAVVDALQDPQLP